MKVIAILLIAITLNGCGRLDTNMPEESEKKYTIFRYHKGLYVGGWTSTTKVYHKFVINNLEHENMQIDKEIKRLQALKKRNKTKIHLLSQLIVGIERNK